MSEYWLEWSLPDGGRMFFAHRDSFPSSNSTDMYLGIFGRAWFSVRRLKGQWWLCFVTARDWRSPTRIELPPTAEEAMVWMRMVAEMSGLKQEKWEW